MTPRSIIFSLAAAAAALQPSYSAAAPIIVEGLPSAKVSYADLNIGTPAGRQTLAKRISGAVKRVCGTAGPVDVRMNAAVRKCRNEAVSSANLQVERALANRFASTGSDIEVGGSL